MTESLRSAFPSIMREVADHDPNLVVMVSDISHGIFQSFARDFPGRFYNIGICEPTIVNMAAGLSKVGVKPVVHTIAPFLIERSFEQIKLDFGYQQLGVNLVSVGGAFDYSQLGCSHHSYADASLVCHVDGSRVFLPGSAHEFRSLFLQAYADPVVNYFRLTENPHEQATDQWDITIGKAIRVRQGHDITIATTGAQLRNATQAADVLAAEGISCEIVYFPTLKPFDTDAVVESVARTRRVVTIEELSSEDGLYNRVLRAAREVEGISCRQLAITGFVHGYGTYDDLCRRAGLSADHLALVVREIMGEAGPHVA